MFCTVEVHATFEVANEAEAQAIIKAAHVLAVKECTHAAEEVADEIVTVRDALQYLMTDAAMELPINPFVVSVYADERAAAYDSTMRVDPTLLARLFSAGVAVGVLLSIAIGALAWTFFGGS